MRAIPTAAILLVALVSAAPLALAQSAGLVTSASADVIIPIPVDSLVINRTLEDSTARPDACGSDVFEASPSEDLFRFSEQNVAATSCGEIGFRYEPPRGATNILVEFEADRRVARTDPPPPAPPPNVPPSCVQELRIADGSGATRRILAVFPDTARTMPFTFFALPVEQAADGGPLNITWYFEDRGFNPLSSTANPGSLDDLAATVRHVRIHIPALPIDVPTARANETRADGHIVTTSIVAFTPPDHDEATPSIGLNITIATGAPFARLETPRGESFAKEQLDRTGTAAGLQFHLSRDFVARHGNGEYRFVFVSTRPIPVAPPAPPVSLLPGYLLLLALPALPGAFAGRAVHSYWKEADGPYVRTARILTAGLAAVTLGYFLLLGYIFVLDRLRPVATLPFVAEAWAVNALIALLVLALVALWVIPARFALRAMREDLNQRKQLQDELARSNRELESFAYVASHDLQEPLRTISGFSQLLASRYGDKLDDRGKGYIDRAVQGSMRMQNLINDLLAYSRVQTQGGEIHPVDLDGTVRTLLADLADFIRREGATVTCDALPTLRVDPTQIGQVFSNLVRNAVKYRHPDRAPIVHIAARSRATEWEFSVRDNGLGIDPAYHDKIFLIFQRIAPANEKEAGTGLGLAITKRIIERHGGRIWVESAPGAGATFRFTIPIKEA